MSGLPLDLLTLMRRTLLYILLSLIVLIAVFYFWGSSSVLSSAQHHQVQTYAAPVKTANDTFSIMTYNLGYLSGMTNNLPMSTTESFYHDNLLKAQRLLNAQQVDIIGFQEIDYASSRSHQVDQLKELSGNYAQAVASINWDKRYVPFPYWPPSAHFGSMLSGQAVLSKFPIKESRTIVLDKPQAAPFYYQAFYLDRLIQLVELQMGSTDLVVLNVHLEAFDQETREAQAEVLLNYVDSLVADRPLLVIGDFNARPPFAQEQVTQEKTMSLFYEHPQLSAAIPKSDYTNNESSYFTFDTSEPYEKLDYIFYNHKFIQALGAKVITEAGQISDHLPVYLSFTFVK